MKISILTQGYKYKHSIDADMVIDARCLVNPYYDENLRDKTGLDKAVVEYISMDCYTQRYLTCLYSYIDCYLDGIENKRDEVRICVMCTGGKHRSVFVANKLQSYLAKRYEVSIRHRDINA